jgi:hypothetical protein
MQPPFPDLPTDWQSRRLYWRRRLGRLRLDAEPIEEQLERYRRVTWVLTAIPAFLAVFFMSLFTAFRYPGVGAVLVGFLLLPIVAIAWFDYLRLRATALAYLNEARAFERRRPADVPGANGSLPPGS